MIYLHRTSLRLAICLSLISCTVARAENWPRFRGPGGAGISTLKGLPVKWTAKDYAWKTKIPGLGHSSPCVWDDAVFLTSAEDDGAKRHLLRVNAQTGRIEWRTSVSSKSNPKHRLNSYASATPTTNGEQVFALFASDERMLLIASSFAGELIWKRDLGPFFQKKGQVHGSGTSPIVFEDLVIVANQQDGQSSLVALDAKSGERRWENVRKLRSTAHSTPFVHRPAGKSPRLVFTNTGDGYGALDPRDGKLLFRANLMPARCVGSPIIAGGLVLATSGGGGKGRYLAGIPVDSKGEVTEAQAAWVKKRNLPYVPTPIAYGNHVFLWGDDGVVGCLEVKTGEQVWRQRVGGTYWGSPVCVDGKLYCVSADGTVAVVRAGPKYELLAKTEIGDQCHSTPAIAGGRMFIRGFQNLYCLAAKEQ